MRAAVTDATGETAFVGAGKGPLARLEPLWGGGSVASARSSVIEAEAEGPARFPYRTLFAGTAAEPIGPNDVLCKALLAPYDGNAMTTEQIRKAHQARPFKPFTLRTGGGREYHVPHPEFLLITPPGRTIVVVDKDGAVELLDLLLVGSLHFDKRRGRRGGDGRRVS